ncbi:restriction endonuclease subunit S [Bifidobacterium anseris]|uniref:restriction endonuclease subunit S n=1 Tax=Bifidobacterium anseris TaxID=2020963 RepID=UPI002434649D|nr:restriction endonuclease subunit S [Bifidobacterium anseris]
MCYAWEQRKLGEIAEVVGGGTPDTNNPAYWNGSINWFTPAEIGSSTYATDSKRKITEEGLQHSSANLLPAYRTILFTSRASIGLVAILTTDACTNQGFQSLVASDQTDVLFLYSLCDRIKRQAIRNAAGSTFLEVSGKQLAKIPVQVPSLSEQRRIGKLFQVIDTLIAAEKRKLILLRDKKSALLSQIFDRKMRFKGYTDPWEQCKLGEIAEIGTGSHNTQDGHLDGRFPFFIRSDQKLFLDYYDYDEEAILIPGDGRIGQIYHYMNGKYALHQRVYRIKVNSSVDTRFILYLMEACFRKHALAMNSQGTVPSLRKPIFTEWSIGLPGDRDEQIKISKLFNQLDNLIDAESQKVDLLELKKKALLQQMFI